MKRKKSVTTMRGKDCTKVRSFFVWDFEAQGLFAWKILPKDGSCDIIFIHNAGIVKKFKGEKQEGEGDVHEAHFDCR